MDKKQLSRQLIQHCGGAKVISCSQLETFLGFGHNKTLSLLEGVDALEINGRRKYFTSDVAERLLERMVR
jgi:hypothetical protein